MFHSAEIRWFLEGTIPGEIREWFIAGNMAVDEAPRVDEYLVLPGCATTGVKFRQYPGDDRATFEIKSRTSEPVASGFGETAQGYIDTWVKWSCRPAEVASFHESIKSGGEQWVCVEKRRCLRKFSMEGTEPNEVEASSMELTNGCQFELTSVRALAGGGAPLDWDSAEPWWSLSFEAFGKTESLPSYVQSVAGQALTGVPTMALAASASRAYPSWLLDVVDRLQRS